MGRKGASRHKPKKTKSLPNDKIKGPSNMHVGESSPAQSLVKSNRTALDDGGPNLAAGSNKRDRKGK